ncbi:hypothetical protein ACH4RA_28660 [Streptomyces smyrnaeus]|uniref:hypothetical protein n=1 Tax=Streptomyces TaxID=1883 RepID=UPI0016143ECE|nr:MULTISPECIES: hypothetical protein [unclassified Streptomyces]MBQ0866331.1 hypothetical protein [Streptomyces sp. RK75]MBQ1124264.1 hypothetical protein [Streptomyces sp. B15]MBQ1162168.1 hypothetical protein [Streptomyces sp. A73]
MPRFPHLSRTATTIAALTVTALVPLCGVAQAAPSDGRGTSASAPAPAAESSGLPRLLELGDGKGLLGFDFLGLI